MGCACTNDSATIVAKHPPDNLSKCRQQINDMSTVTKYPYSTTAVSITKNVSRTEVKEFRCFTIELFFTKEKHIVTFPSKDDTEYVLFIDLVNKSLFSNLEYDCNFLCEYDKEKDEFKYIIDRIHHKKGLLDQSSNLEVDSHLKWVIFINKEVEDFNLLCHMNRVVSKSDIVEFKLISQNNESLVKTIQ